MRRLHRVRRVAWFAIMLYAGSFVVRDEIHGHFRLLEIVLTVVTFLVAAIAVSE